MSEDASSVERVGLRFVDLFAGCGGLALGFLQQGFEPVAAVEWDPSAAETYRQNIDDRIAASDITSVLEWPRADVVVGGPPCQGFSQLGTRDPNDPRNRLWIEYVRVLDATEADVFVMENVPQLIRSPQFEQFRREVELRGFRLAARVLLAADYGVPQMRRRAIVIGSRRGIPQLPVGTHGPGTAHPHATVRDAFGAHPPLPERPDGVNWHVARLGIRPTSITRYRAVPPDGGNRFQMQANLDSEGLGELVPACWRRKESGTTDVFGRLWWDRPASTIRTEFFKPEKGRYLHPSADRPITVREAARLQSFPDTFVFDPSQSTSEVAKQIGNAVPPRLAGAVARSVLAHIRAPLAECWTSEEPRQLELVG